MNKIDITLYVLSPVANQLTDAVRKELQGNWSGNEEDIQFITTRYGNSPDDWMPFENGIHVSQYLKQDFQINSLSSVPSLPKNSQIFRDTTLYIIDPLLLLVPKPSITIDFLLVSLQTKDTAFCLLVSNVLSNGLRQRLIDYFTTNYKWVIEAHEKGQGRFGISNISDLKNYISSLNDRLVMKSLLSSLGAKDPGISSAPGLG